VGVYTSSQVEKFGDTLPIGVIQVPAIRAGQAGGQLPFFIDVRRRAFIPFTRQFFPEIDSPGHGLIGPADKGLLQQIIKQYQLVNDRPKWPILSMVSEIDSFLVWQHIDSTGVALLLRSSFHFC
jgi:hypothetical protein